MSEIQYITEEEHQETIKSTIYSSLIFISLTAPLILKPNLLQSNPLIVIVVFLISIYPLKIGYKALEQEQALNRH